MGGDDFLSALGSLTNALFLIASVYIYIGLLRQINRRDREVLATNPGFGVAEVALATFLIGVFGFSSLGASSVQIVRLRTSDLILNAVVSIGIVLFVVAFLKLRHFNITELTGLAKLGFARTFITGLVLLIFAYPLIIFADWLTARVLGSGSSRQGIIELFSGSQSMEQRIIIILLATVVSHLLPAVSLLPPGTYAWSQPKLLILPVATLVIVIVPYIFRMMRAAMIEALESDYVEMARLKGVPEWQIVLAHALPNAIAPTIQVIGLNFLYLAGGVVVVEFVFNFPGIGQGLVFAVQNRDIPVIQFIVLVLAAFYVVMNIVTDVIALLATPRRRIAR